MEQIDEEMFNRRQDSIIAIVNKINLQRIRCGIDKKMTNAEKGRIVANRNLIGSDKVKADVSAYAKKKKLDYDSALKSYSYYVSMQIKSGKMI